MLLSVVAGLALTQGPSYPSVFRAVFEDRPRQLVIVLNRKPGATPVGFVFHPEIGAIRKVWSGTIDYRGKVYDFSQNNSRTEGKTLWEAPSEAIRLPDQADRATEWQKEGVTFTNSAWQFTGDNAKLTSPIFALGTMQAVYVGFDETSTTTAFTLRLLQSDGRELTKFESSTAQDSNWQWNYKKIPFFPGDLRLEVSQRQKSDQKRIRNLRVFGDYPVWSIRRGETSEVTETELKGYRINGPESITVTCQIGAALVDWEPNITPTGWSETFRVRGVRAGQQLTLFRPGLDDQPIAMTNGEYVLRHTR